MLLGGSRTQTKGPFGGRARITVEKKSRPLCVRAIVGDGQMTGSKKRDGR